MDWAKINVSFERVAQGDNQRLQHELKNQIDAAGWPSGAAVFSTSLTPDGSVFYITPEAVAHCEPVITRWAGTPCEKPPVKRLLFLLGHDQDRFALQTED